MSDDSLKPAATSSPLDGSAVSVVIFVRENRPLLERSSPPVPGETRPIGTAGRDYRRRRRQLRRERRIRDAIGNNGVLCR